MARKLRHRSDALRSAHLAAQDLHGIGAIDKATMRKFDRICLIDVEELGPAGSSLSVTKPIVVVCAKEPRT